MRSPPVPSAARAARSVLLAAATASTCASDALADAAPDEWRSSTYYAVNGGVTAALIAGGALAGAAREGLEAGGDTVWFPGDSGLRGRCSPEAAHLSDVSFTLTVALPLGMELAGGLDARFVNAEIVYSQALLANHLLTAAAKVFFRRPRPFSYRKGADCGFDIDDPDANMSFFSGHASGSFAAAVAGSLLLSEVGLDSRTRAAVWGTELALAAATANLRARAGKHYYSDILVGALVGTGVGIALPVLHGADDPPSGSDLLAGAIGLVLGVGGSQLIAIGAEAIEESPIPSVAFAPLPLAGSVGLQASGVF